MQIESLKVFCDLAETESFTKAAQINGVTQSAVSQQISSLERLFKSLLIERSKKKFRLTREGQMLYDFSKQIIQTYESLHSKLQELKDIISGTIRVATIYSIGLHDLPPYIKKFLKSYPTVNVHVEYRRANQVYDDVLSNVVDMGLVAYPSKDSKLEIVSLRKDPLVLICHPQHPFARQKSIRLKALTGQKFIGFEPDRRKLLQIRRIQRLQILRHEQSVFADQFAVEPHFAAAPFGPLDQHHVPMHRRAVAVVAFLVGLARREVQRTGDFLVEQNVAHRIQNIGIEPERKFAHVTRAGVGVQNFIQPLRVVRRRVDDFAVLEFQPDVFKFRSRINRRRVELNHAVHGIFHRAGKHLAVGNVAVALAHFRADALDAEGEVGARDF
jgi:DNA-binding transcriptional LysR family regulator